MNDKKPLFFLLVIAAVYLSGLAMGAVAGISGRRERRELRERLEQVTGDLNSAIESQREAAGRAAILQTELQGLTNHARIIEEGARRLEARAIGVEARSGSLAEQLDGIIDQSGELTNRISRANDSLEESRILLDELGNLIRSLP